MKGLLSASSTTGVEMDMKEFSHTNDLIENAEEWMARVREVLESGEPATLHGLEALLTEAEGIPVTMDEQQLLTVGIKARQWRLRVDSTLAGGRAKLHDLQDLATKVRVSCAAVEVESRYDQDQQHEPYDAVHKVFMLLWSYALFLSAAK